MTFKLHTQKSRLFRTAVLLGLSGLLLQGCPKPVDPNPVDPNPIVKPNFAAKTCAAAVSDFNTAFNTVSGLSGGKIDPNSGVLVHTTHGPGSGTAEFNMAKLNAMTPEPNTSCGDFLGKGTYLPWCGNNTSNQVNDASSWTYIRHDTLNHDTPPPPLQRTDEVYCSDSNNKKYGLIFNMDYLNGSYGGADNLGCMYPLDGDTGPRQNRGCGKTTNPSSCIDNSLAAGACGSSMTESQYLTDFDALLKVVPPAEASCAGSMVCSLDKSQFDIWVDARKNIDLTYTSWPINEFVLHNWTEYSAQQLADDGILVGFYYLTGCGDYPVGSGNAPSDGTAQNAQAFADLFAKWTGTQLPVVNLSNETMKNKGTTPFSCPT